LRTRLWINFVKGPHHRSVISYSTVISAFCRKGRMDDAMEIFNQMMGHVVRPDEAMLISRCF
jgi:pentatricopeptide repeat protein